ncbi:HNH endonuclease [Corallococcus sp. BB11-1]|uniref:HNH endonuclease n=1 Tax=Corallococcus sp. BB11-1 TaxID=2996783 RepID=UPI00226E3EDD|nr:HNH endonuclease [Corallococcus sp. BB11-1]MCY1032172.1 HNH endonuclease [Corallococcus sp. BB11-1]
MAAAKKKRASRRKPIPHDVARALFAKSAGYCQNPICNAELFRFFEDGEVASIQELAHIVAQSVDGPRGASGLSPGQRDGIDNIILLCPSCHTLVDKKPKSFPVKLLHEWKAEHEQRVAALFVAAKCKTRVALNQELAPLFRQNRSIFEVYGPTSERADLLVTDMAGMWKQQVLHRIIPNNRKISALLRQNRHLLKKPELDAVDKFFLHQEGFEFNHLSGGKNKDVPLFPRELTKLFGEK